MFATVDQPTRSVAASLRISGRFALRLATSAVLAYAAAARSMTASANPQGPELQAVPAHVAAPVQDGVRVDDDSLCGGTHAGASCLVVPIDHLRRVTLPTAAKTVLVGNPAIADVDMIAVSQAVVSARSVGSTNLIFLDGVGDLIASYEVVVKEPRGRRVTLRRGPQRAEQYLCAPMCERTLTQNDDTKAFEEAAGKIDEDWKLNDAGAAAGGQGGGGRQ